MKRGAARGLAVLMAAFLCALCAPRPAAAMVGETAEAGDLAGSVVMLLSRAGRTAGFCSAVVVAPDALLTAAHCVPPGAELRAFLGADAPAGLLDVAAVERSPGFRPDAIRSRERSVDLALVRLAKPPTGLRPVMLGAVPAHAPGAAFRFAGFGLRQEGVAASSGRLRAVTLVARAPASDLLLWAEGRERTPTGACTGDSGGPVLAEGVVVAVTAWASGVGSRRCGTLTQAVWIAPQRAWIDGVLQRWGDR